MKKYLIVISLICCVLCLCLAYLHIEKRVTKFELPQGELKWSNVRPVSAKMCIPAAFTGPNGKIIGSYRVAGHTHQNGKAMKMKVSLKGDTFVLGSNWVGDYGFQQLTLVNNSKPMRFKDSRRAMRRALCKSKDKTFIIESNYPMKISSFAYYCSKHCEYAVYLDMGEYGYGYIKRGHFIRPLHIIGLFTKHKQTNWIYIE